MSVVDVRHLIATADPDIPYFLLVSEELERCSVPARKSFFKAAAAEMKTKAKEGGRLAKVVEGMNQWTTLEEKAEVIHAYLTRESDDDLSYCETLTSPQMVQRKSEMKAREVAMAERYEVWNKIKDQVVEETLGDGADFACLENAPWDHATPIADITSDMALAMDHIMLSKIALEKGQELAQSMLRTTRSWNGGGTSLGNEVWQRHLFPRVKAAEGFIRKGKWEEAFGEVLSIVLFAIKDGYDLNWLRDHEVEEDDMKKFCVRLSKAWTKVFQRSDLELRLGSSAKPASSASIASFFKQPVSADTKPKSYRKVLEMMLKNFQKEVNGAFGDCCDTDIQIKFDLSPPKPTKKRASSSSDQPTNKAKKLKPLAPKPKQKALSEAQRSDMLSKLAVKVVKAFGKTKVTSNSNKPWCEVAQAMDIEKARALVGNFGNPKSDTKKYFWKKFEEHASIQELFPTLPPKVQAEFTGKVLCFGGSRGKVMCNVECQSLDYKYDKSAGALTLKFRLKQVKDY